MTACPVTMSSMVGRATGNGRLTETGLDVHPSHDKQGKRIVVLCPGRPCRFMIGVSCILTCVQLAMHDTQTCGLDSCTFKSSTL